MFMESYMWREDSHKKMMPMSGYAERRMDIWVGGYVGENHDITVSSQDIPNGNFNFYKSCFTEMISDDICNTGGKAPQDRFWFLWISTTAFIKPPFLISVEENITKTWLCRGAVSGDIRYNLKARPWCVGGGVTTELAKSFFSKLLSLDLWITSFF